MVEGALLLVLTGAPAGGFDSVCAVVIHELMAEVRKFSMQEAGEDDIFETVPAICFAVVTKYRYAPGQGRRHLVAIDAADSMGAPMEARGNLLQAASELKAECESWTEEWHLELSALAWKHAGDRDPAHLAAEFCPGAVRPERRKGSPRRRQAEAEGAAAARLLTSLDVDGSLRRMVQLEAEHPEAMLDEGALESMHLAASQVVCDVCVALVSLLREAADVVPRRPGGPPPEAALVDVVDGLCAGPRARETDLPHFPGNPPTWALERFVLVQDDDGDWHMRPRREPPSAEAIAEDKDAFQDLVWQGMALRRACVNARADAQTERGEDLASFAHRHWQVLVDQPREAAAALCAATCPAPA